MTMMIAQHGDATQNHKCCPANLSSTPSPWTPTRLLHGPATRSASRPYGRLLPLHWYISPLSSLTAERSTFPRSARRHYRYRSACRHYRSRPVLSRLARCHPASLGGNQRAYRHLSISSRQWCGHRRRRGRPTSYPAAMGSKERSPICHPLANQPWSRPEPLRCARLQHATPDHALERRDACSLYGGSFRSIADI